MPKSDTGLLPLRVPSKEHRAANGLLSSLADVQPGQTAFAVVVVRGVAERRKEAFGRDQVEQVHVGARLAKGALRTFIYLGATSLDLIAATCGWRPQLRGRVSSLFESTPSKEGFERKYDNQLAAKISDKATRQLFTGALYVGVIDECGRSATGFADHLANELTGASVPEEAVTTTRLETMPVRDARPAIVAAPPRFDDARLLFTADELAALFHAPDAKTDTRGLRYPTTSVPLLPPPPFLATEWKPGRVLVGEAMPGGDPQLVYVSADDLLSTHETGLAGTGKSFHLGMVGRDLCRSGHPTFVYDPHGSLADGIVIRLAQEAPELLTAETRLVLLSFCDENNPPAWNILLCRDETERRVADSLSTDLLKALVGDYQSDLKGRGAGRIDSAKRLLTRANQAIYERAIAEGRDPRREEYLTFLDLRHFFNVWKPELRRLVLRHGTEDQRERFVEWETDDPKKLRSLEEEMAVIMNRLYTIADNELFANVIDAPRWPEHRINFREWVEGGTTVLFNLFAGAGWEHNEAVMAVLFNQHILQVEELFQRRGGKDPLISFALLDEVQRIAEVSGQQIVTTLAERRKMGFYLWAAHQYLDQLPKDLRDAFTTNTRQHLTLRVDDAKGEAAIVLKGLDTKRYKQSVIEQLPDQYGIARMTVTNPQAGERIPVPPFTFRVPFSPIPEKESDAGWNEVAPALEATKERGRRLYGRSRQQAERERAAHYDRIIATLTRLGGHGDSPKRAAPQVSSSSENPTTQGSLSSHAGAGIDAGQGVGERRIDELFGEPPAES
jgi:hypothetical protein